MRTTLPLIQWLFGSVLALGFTLAACQDEPETPPETQTQAAAQPEATPPAPKVVPEPAANLPARRFLEVSGKVTLNGKPAVVGQEIPASCTLETAKGAHAVVTFQPGNVTELRERTRVKIGSSKRKSLSLGLAFGALWNVLPKGQADYEVTTANAVAGVRGTTFYITADKKETHVCACDGDVEITAGAALPRNVSSQNEHKAFVARGKAKKAKLAENPKNMPHHTDEQVATVQGLLPK